MKNLNKNRQDEIEKKYREENSSFSTVDEIQKNIILNTVFMPLFIMENCFSFPF